jgi:hypothetical protein
MAAFGTIMLASVLLFIVMGRRMSVRKLAPG